MKKIISGISFMFFGLIMYLNVRDQALSFFPEVSGWPTDKGRWWAALNEINGLAPTNIGISFCVVGVVFILWGIVEDEIKNNSYRNKDKQISDE